jgi:1-acyl-sn-glycerol-3-phosphate acyltransferase
MRAWVPPRVLRRLIVDPLWIPLAAVIAVVFIAAGLIGLLTAAFDRRRVLRIVALGLVYLWIDVGLLVGALLLWVRHPRRRRDEETWRALNSELLNRGLTHLLGAAQRLFGYEVQLVGSPISPDPTRPLIALARHAGPGDSFTLVHLLMTEYRRRPKVVLKQALQWDPGLDVIATRLDCYFLPSVSGAGDDRRLAVADMAAGLECGEAMLLFPEGGNWTPRRHRRAVVRLLRAGRPRAARRARDKTHVLPPRPGGTVASLTARSDTDVLVIAHTGLDTLVNPGQMWRALPLRNRPMRIRAWLHSAPTVPRDEAGVRAWLDEQWAGVDQWIETQRRYD